MIRLFSILIITGLTLATAGHVRAQSPPAPDETIAPEAPPGELEMIPPGAADPFADDADQETAEPAERSAASQPAASESARTAEPEVPAEKFELFEFRQLPLNETLRLFSEQTGLNVVPSEQAATKVVSLYLTDVTAQTALDALCKAYGLWSRKDAATGVIHIYTTEEYNRDLATFREEQTEVFTLLYPNPVDVAQTIENIFGDRVLLTLGDDRQDTTMQELQERFERFDLIDERSEGMGLFGTEGMGTSSGGSRGSRSGSSGYGGYGSSGGYGGYGGYGSSGLGRGRNRGQSFLRDTRAEQERSETRQIPRLEQYEDLTPEEIQVLEAYYSQQGSVDQAVLDELLRRRRATIYVSVIERNNQMIVRTGDEKTMEEIRRLIAQLDVPTPLVLLEVKIMSVDLGDDFSSVFDYQFSDGVTVAGGFTTGNILPPISDNPARITPPLTRRDSSISPATNSVWNNSASSEDLTFQFVNDNFRFRMQLLETKNRVTTLATPLLLTANNEVSRIFIGDTEPFTIGFEAPQVVTSGTTQTNIVGTPITELRDVGQLLLITPSINADRTVTLRMAEQESRKVEGAAFIPVVNADGLVTQTPVDTVARETVSGTIVAKDGLTVALGGLIDERVTDIRSEVPIVGKLPVVGFFFRRQATGRERRETVILVRPYVFNTPCETAAASEQVLRNLSVHPNVTSGDDSLRTHAAWEAIRPDAPANECENTFRFHSVRPRRF